jgi:hypothetical protein
MRGVGFDEGGRPERGAAGPGVGWIRGQGMGDCLKKALCAALSRRAVVSQSAVQ